MEESFESLRSDVCSKQLRSTIETMIRIFRNIHENPTEEKFKSIKVQNKKFTEDVWQFENARNFMKICGWIVNYKNGELCIVYPARQNIKDSLMFLIENRDVKPLASEWIDETKKIIPNAENERERQLRAEAKIKKEKEMIELKKDMAERKQIAEQIRREHIDSRRHKKAHHSPAKAQPLPSQVRMTHQTSSPSWRIPPTSPANVLGASPSGVYGTPRPISPEVNPEHNVLTPQRREQLVPDYHD